MFADTLSKTNVSTGPVKRTSEHRAGRSAGNAVAEDYICISRMIGAAGDEIAQEVGRRLGWPVYDRDILALMSGDDDRVCPREARLTDEERQWCEEILRPTLAARCQRAVYVQRLGETIKALAARGPAVIVGRGGASVLPRDCGLRIRIIGSMDVRLRRYCALHDLGEHEARWEMERLNARRLDFVRVNFGGCSDDPLQFDLVINTDWMTTDQAADVIEAAHRALGR